MVPAPLVEFRGQPFGIPEPLADEAVRWEDSKQPKGINSIEIEVLQSALSGFRIRFQQQGGNQLAARPALFAEVFLFFRVPIQQCQQVAVRVSADPGAAAGLLRVESQQFTGAAYRGRERCGAASLLVAVHDRNVAVLFRKKTQGAHRSVRNRKIAGARREIAPVLPYDEGRTRFRAALPVLAADSVNQLPLAVKPAGRGPRRNLAIANDF